MDLTLKNIKRFWNNLIRNGVQKVLLPEGQIWIEKAELMYDFEDTPGFLHRLCTFIHDFEYFEVIWNKDLDNFTSIFQL